MRRVLESKLRLDGVSWDALTLKPSLRNLLRGRFRLLRDPVAYKLVAMLRARAECEVGLDEVLFGDDAESDAFVYSLYSDLCAGKITEAVLTAVLLQAHVPESEVGAIVRLAARVPRRDMTRRIFIHLDRVSPRRVRGVRRAGMPVLQLFSTRAGAARRRSS